MEHDGRDGAPFARLRADEFGYLDETRQIYLDHTGATPAPRSLVDAQAARLRGAVFGNPHTESPASAASTALVEAARQRVLRFLDADPAEYTVIFTANASQAVKLVGEAYPFHGRRGPALLLTQDNHNSVNGVREFARSAGARVRLVPFSGEELRVDGAAVRAALAARRQGGLFCFPAQSNFSGVRHPLEWVDQARRAGWHTLLDAAAYLPTGTLSLRRTPADFAVVSWYKVFGYPSGVGSLVARREALAALGRPWFAGGTIQVVSAQARWHRMAQAPAAFEDGTPDFHAVPQIATGLDWYDAIGADRIADHVTALTGQLLRGLRALRHRDGRPLIRVYGPRGTENRGGTVALNVLDRSGRIVDERIVARECSAAGISVRTGCFCNPGAGEEAFAIAPRLLRRTGSGRDRAATIDGYIRRLGLPSGGAVRVSPGVANVRSDIDRFLEFLTATFAAGTPVGSAGLGPRLTC
ncbi:aminotransferase class V-fold PLP-dependent enzyme [Streptomyces sp. VRA16 Mangrove soil]|uniref:aminotransferase class V-fold PLP-dependent enzyme n=1 Tax=Streptomyces sp. VRA16 Mangrove soil TaxID=2817434 RepID=UPI001A9F67AA|nr:aminotransferase class V-fold PLP-dependent enzyme [Streptomyces sp. VRA16 Mangrove soil]MBO1330147.1 aminotransferase class V-fold PLP-dependent enzyme [Streptomyces sp. VRA16 Mangrove soil]